MQRGNVTQTQDQRGNLTKFLFDVDNRLTVDHRCGQQADHAGAGRGGLRDGGH